MRFRNLAEPGGPQFPEASVKALAIGWPNKISGGLDDQGNPIDRLPGLADPILGPFKNDKQARAAQNGALPPDLSLIAKARPLKATRPGTRTGSDAGRHRTRLSGGWRRTTSTRCSLATAIRRPACKVADGMYYNVAFPGHQLAMPPPLSKDKSSSIADGTPRASLDQNARDVAAFLAWAADPTLEDRKRTGLQVLLYLLVTTLLYLRSGSSGAACSIRRLADSYASPSTASPLIDRRSLAALRPMTERLPRCDFRCRRRPCIRSAPRRRPERIGRRRSMAKVRARHRRRQRPLRSARAQERALGDGRDRPGASPRTRSCSPSSTGCRSASCPATGAATRCRRRHINYRANIDALKRAGVTDLVSVSACGSLKEELPPGHFVLVDQFIDRTFAREKSFFGAGCVAHVSMADPVSPLLVDADRGGGQGAKASPTRAAAPTSSWRARSSPRAPRATSTAAGAAT